ncbi:42825_t:CDS:1, partial [Gigaspora margarita]
ACANIITIPIDLSPEADIISTNNIFDDYDFYIMNQNMPISVFTSTSSDTFIGSGTKIIAKDIADLTLSFFNFNNTEPYCKNFTLQSNQHQAKAVEI